MDDVAIYNYVRWRLRARRLELKMTQEEAAGPSGISRTTLTNIEAGVQGVRIPELYRICRTLDVEPREVLPSLGEAEKPTEVKVNFDGEEFSLSPDQHAKIRRILRKDE